MTAAYHLGAATARVLRWWRALWPHLREAAEEGGTL